MSGSTAGMVARLKRLHEDKARSSWTGVPNQHEQPAGDTDVAVTTMIFEAKGLANKITQLAAGNKKPDRCDVGLYYKVLEAASRHPSARAKEVFAILSPYRGVIKAKEMEQTLFHLNEWISQTAVKIATHPDLAPLVPSHELLFRFCDLDSPTTMMGKIYWETSSIEVRERIRDLAKIESQKATKFWRENQNLTNAKTSKADAEQRLKAAEVAIRAYNHQAVKLIWDEKIRLAEAMRHVGGNLVKDSPFVSLAQNIEGFVPSDNKVAQSIVRSQENYVQQADFTEFPNIVAGFKRAPHLGIFFIPTHMLLSTERILTGNGLKADGTSAVERAREYLFYAAESIEPYLVAYRDNPF